MRFSFRTLALAASLTGLPALASATDLLQAWHAAQQHDKELAVARADHARAQAQRDQAQALWRPGVALSLGAGLASSETQMHGAEFSAPGMGSNSGVNFGTSVNGGLATRVALQASQPLYHPQRRAQQAQLTQMADLTELQWQAQQQQAMLRTAQRYFALALAEENLRVVTQQQAAVQKAHDEAQERYRIGSAPITDTHEAQARLAALQAQRLAAQTERNLRQRELADSTGLAADTLRAHLPGPAPDPAPVLAPNTTPAQPPLAHWQARASEHSLAIRMRQLAAQLAQAEADKHSQRASATVELVAQAMQERVHGSGDYGRAHNKNLNAMVGVQLNVPLYTGGWRSAKEEESLRARDKAEAEVLHTQELIAQQVHAAWLGLSTGQERVHALQAALSASQARLQATETGREVGDRTLLDVLNAQTDHAASQLALAQARTEVLLSQLRLALLTSELDEAQLQRINQHLALHNPAASATQ